MHLFTRIQALFEFCGASSWAVQAVPVDGEVWQGRSMVTVEHLTGEAEPIEKKVGDSVPGGARNLDGMLIIKVRPFSLTLENNLSVFDHFELK